MQETPGLCLGWGTVGEKGHVVVPVLQEEVDGRRNVSEMFFIEHKDFSPVQLRWSRGDQH